MTVTLRSGPASKRWNSGEKLATASSAPWYQHRRGKQCFCTHKALQAMSLFIQSSLALQELVGQHPKPFDRAAPAGRSTSAVTILLTSTKCFSLAYIFVPPRKHTILPPSAKWSAIHKQRKAPRPRQCVSEGFCLCL